MVSQIDVNKLQYVRIVYRTVMLFTAISFGDTLYLRAASIVYSRKEIAISNMHKNCNKLLNLTPMSTSVEIGWKNEISLL